MQNRQTRVTYRSSAPTVDSCSDTSADPVEAEGGGLHNVGENHIRRGDEEAEVVLNIILHVVGVGDVTSEVIMEAAAIPPVRSHSYAERALKRNYKIKYTKNL